jgi:hypothetical protein
MLEQTRSLRELEPHELESVYGGAEVVSITQTITASGIDNLGPWVSITTVVTYSDGTTQTSTKRIFKPTLNA